MDVCPLVFEPILKPKIWGGRKLAEVLGKRLPDPAERYGESWECADLEGGQSVVARGPAAGKTLHELVQTWGRDLLGRAEGVDGRFPLVIKFLDAASPLSIQVHPDPSSAACQGGRVPVKHEAWYVIEAAPGAFIYRGLRPSADLDAVRQALAEQPAAILDFIKRVPVKAGQAYYLPAGTIHSLGAGVLVAEIQTPSEVTYRLYDWDRHRPETDAGLHIEEGSDCLRPRAEFAVYERRSHVTSLFTTVTRLVACPSFVLERVRFVEGIEQEIPYAELVIWVVLEGEGEVSFTQDRLRFQRGDVVILPAGLKCARLKVHTGLVFLEVTIPADSDLKPFARPEREVMRRLGGSPSRPIQVRIDRPQN